jgi:mannitol/fructose-specific phosphotransferase system IIA component (Ntr-type)
MTEAEFNTVLKVAAQEAGIALPHADFEQAIRAVVDAAIRLSKYTPAKTSKPNGGCA